MANPNIVAVTTITGKTNLVKNVAITTGSQAVLNSSNSGQIYKINSLLVSNNSTTVNYTVDAYITRSSVNYYIARGIVIPAAASLIVISKDNSVYLEEGDFIQVIAGFANILDCICSYEIISAA
jgi:hypothetical protein